MQRRMARRLVESPGFADEASTSAIVSRVARQADLSAGLLGRPFFMPSKQPTSIRRLR